MAVNEQVTLSARESTTFHTVAVVPAGVFKVSGAPLQLDNRDVGTLVLGTSLDNAYAKILADLSRADIVITVNDKIVARTVPEGHSRSRSREDELGKTTQLNGEEYAVGTLLSSGPVRIYSDVDRRRRPRRHATR